MIEIGVAGYRGRMGQLIVKELQSGQWKGLELAAGSTRSIHAEHYPSENFSIVATSDELTQACDCVIDFTTPELTSQIITAALKSQTALVIGTTGLNADHEKILKDAAKSIPIVYAANTSIGVNILLAIVEQAASKLGPEWDIEIFESHHKNKVDAPSGTALALGKAAAKGRNIIHPATPPSYTSPLPEGGGRVGGPRPQGQIGYAVSRGGDVVGEHMVTFYGMGERIELGHKASDRSLFAKGALKAAQWLNGKPAGLYTMRDVLGL